MHRFEKIFLRHATKIHYVFCFPFFLVFHKHKIPKTGISPICFIPKTPVPSVHYYFSLAHSLVVVVMIEEEKDNDDAY